MGMKIGRVLFASACAGALVLSVGYPGWAAETQSQVYGGYVDLALQSVGLQDEALAGDEFTLPLRITNHGPQTADVPQVVFSADHSLRLTRTEGCVGSPATSAQCVLATPLASGESRELAFVGWLNPSARGLLTTGAFALSEAIDVQPGNEMVVTATPIQARVDLVVQTLTESPEVMGDGRLRWAFELRNAGPSDALAFHPSFWSVPWQGADLTCMPVDAFSRCADNQNAAIVAVGGGLRFEAIVPPLSASNPEIWISLYANPLETELNFADNQSSVSFADSLFVDEFEY